MPCAGADTGAGCMSGIGGVRCLDMKAPASLRFREWTAAVSESVLCSREMVLAGLQGGEGAK